MTAPLLADAFADQCRRWAADASPAALRALESAARAIATAAAAGHVCVDLESLPDIDHAQLLESGIVGAPGAGRPLVLDGNRLYLARHDDYERRLAANLVARLKTGRLCIVAGGPGTGKTTRVARLLGERLEQNPDLRIGLAAPTGKAAARMMESLRARAADLPPAVAARLPDEAATVHRLLGIAPGRVRRLSDPLALDVLVVDEASMLDLALAARLVDALPAEAELILLGDRDQLAAVESGAVFAELTLPDEDNPLTPLITRLSQSYRFGSETALGRLAAAVRDNRPKAAVAELGADASVTLLADAATAPTATTWQRLIDGYRDYFAAIAAFDGDPRPVFEAFGRFRILSPLRIGPRGVEALNTGLDRHAAAEAATAQGAWYTGRPIMILANDPATRLFNGDIGIVLPHGDGLCACFAEGADFRRLPLARLPAHESAFALTVHKSQGSEFDRIAFLLPSQELPLLTRELAYTAITRARHGIDLIGDPALLECAIGRPTIRYSGLAARLGQLA
ncbi:MAG: exodeoxyribonuclease V subunit alpha [Betaproteobacteria bacterium]